MLKLAGVAVLFAICGAWSSQLVHGGERELISLPVPFALLCALLFWRSIRAIPIVPAIAIVWLAAYSSAMDVAINMGVIYGVLGDSVPMVAGGLVGGFGLSLCAGIFYGRLRWREVCGTSLAGMISALAFVPLLAASHSRLNGAEDSGQPWRARYAFAIWQAVVGTYLYSMANRSGRLPKG